MTRPEFLSPAGELDAGMVRIALELAGREPDAAIIGQWTPHELMIAYDWAMRQHLIASDNQLRARDEPWIVRMACARPALAAAMLAEGSQEKAPPENALRPPVAGDALLRDAIRRALWEAGEGGLATGALMDVISHAGVHATQAAVEKVLDDDDDVGLILGVPGRWVWASAVPRGGRGHEAARDVRGEAAGARLVDLDDRARHQPGRGRGRVVPGAGRAQDRRGHLDHTHDGGPGNRRGVAPGLGEGHGLRGLRLTREAGTGTFGLARNPVFRRQPE